MAHACFGSEKEEIVSETGREAPKVVLGPVLVVLDLATEFLAWYAIGEIRVTQGDRIRTRNTCQSISHSLFFSSHFL